MKRALAHRSRFMSPAKTPLGVRAIPQSRRGAPASRSVHSDVQESNSSNKGDLPPRLIVSNSHKQSQLPKHPLKSATDFQDVSRNYSNGQHTDGIDSVAPASPWQRQRPAGTVAASGKRKARVSVGPGPARRRKIARSEAETNSRTPATVLEDEAFMLRTLNLPTTNDYPRMPAGMLDTPKQILHNSFQGILKLRSSFPSLKPFHFSCQVGCVVSGRDSVFGRGDGKTKKEAEKAAYLQLISNLHENGLLKALFAEKAEILDNETLKEEKDAKLDIYNYAARYNCVPRISVKKVEGLYLRVQRRNGKSRTLIEVCVELPEQNIMVTGQGQNLGTAEVSAAIKFKKEAERYQAEQGTDSLVIKDFTALNFDNGRSFFEFYKMQKRDARLEIEVSTLNDYKSYGTTMIGAKVILDDIATGDPVFMGTKKKAEDLACLTAAIEVVKKEPGLLKSFFNAQRTSSGEILRPLSSVDMVVDDDCVALMQDTLLKARRLGLTDEQEELEPERDLAETRQIRSRKQLGIVEAEQRSIQLERRFREYLSRPDLEELRRKRKELPMNQYRDKVLDIVNNHTYSIIVGATGSGKTTQVPQILLEQAIQNNKAAACNIICTQPRRIAATSVARRVAEERAEPLQDTVGHHVRFDAKLPRVGGSMTYCTTGILLQQLQHAPDDVLDNTSHLIIDEVHERDMQIDFLLIILKKVMARRLSESRSVPKVVLMSATMDSDMFASYFKNATPGGETICPTLSVPGRTFPVKELYLESILETLDKSYGASQLQAMYEDAPTREYFEVEKDFAKNNSSAIDTQSSSRNQLEPESIIDWKKERVLNSSGEVAVSNEKSDALVPHALVATTIAHIAETTSEGAILVFLPGLDEMVKVDRLLRERKILGVDFQDESKYKMYMLHSSIAAGQNEVFDPVPPGCRKIILGTNIAETSITIPDVQYVVDSGKLREKQYDQLRRITKLQCTWISKSNSKQRAGRAGRVQNGHYYALFSKERYNSIRAIGLPELLRADLQETCLDIKAQAFKTPIREFLAESIEPPSPHSVNAAVVNLQALNALTDEEKLTSLGRLLATLPVHPALGKMIVLGVIFRCLDPMILLGAAAEERPLFASPLERRREANMAKESFVQGSGSDHISFLNAFREARRIQQERGQNSLRDFASRKFVHMGAFKSIDGTARQIEEILVDAKLIPYVPRNARSDHQYGDELLNENSDKIHVIKALALAGFHPNLGVTVTRGGGRTLRTPGERGVLLHPSSVNNTKSDKEGLKFGTLFSYSTMAKSNDGRTIFLRDTSESTPLMVTLFGGHLQGSPTNSRLLDVGDWLPFYIKSDDPRARKTIIEFRKALERLLTSAFADLSSKKFLAEDPVRECFAEGLVEVLNRDVRLGERTIGKGWDSGAYGGFGGLGGLNGVSRLLDMGRRNQLSGARLSAMKR